MKRVIVLCVFVVFFGLCYADEGCFPCYNRENPCPDCRYTIVSGMESYNFPLAGDVKVYATDSLKADLWVYVVEYGADLVVSWVDYEPYYCGQWRKVDKNEDFSVYFCSNPHNADIFIRFGDAVKEYPVGYFGFRL